MSQSHGIWPVQSMCSRCTCATHVWTKISAGRCSERLAQAWQHPSVSGSGPWQEGTPQEEPASCPAPQSAAHLCVIHQWRYIQGTLSCQAQLALEALACSTTLLLRGQRKQWSSCRCICSSKARAYMTSICSCMPLLPQQPHPAMKSRIGPEAWDQVADHQAAEQCDSWAADAHQHITWGLTLLLSDQRCSPLLGHDFCAFHEYSGIAWRMIAATSCLQQSTPCGVLGNVRGHEQAHQSYCGLLWDHLSAAWAGCDSRESSAGGLQLDLNSYSKKADGKGTLQWCWQGPWACQEPGCRPCCMHRCYTRLAWYLRAFVQ